MPKEPDIINELAELAFATRLKRLSERLMRDVSRIYHDLDLDFEARWFSILYALSEHSPMTVTALARTLRLTHPAVNQLAGEMITRKLLLTAKGKKDERQRLLRLSAGGRAMAERLAPVWGRIRDATRELIDEAGEGLIDSIGKIETLLDNRDMYRRVTDRLPAWQGEGLEIVDYRPAWKKRFRDLNVEWLDRLFSVEEADEKMLSDPNGLIIRKGGAVLFARLDDRVVGTCALIPLQNGVIELAKMAVEPAFRGRKAGRSLAMAAIDRARALGASTLFVETSPKLEIANRLYEKIGFKRTAKPLRPRLQYRRKSFTMTLDLASTRRSRQ